jgi:alkyl sulfatase BDS1-like metallo-beta-lactamase superfamily hydrolase
MQAWPVAAMQRMSCAHASQALPPRRFAASKMALAVFVRPKKMHDLCQFRVMRGNTGQISTREDPMTALDEARHLVAEDDRKDFDFAARGFIATRKDPKIMRDDGKFAAFDLSSYKFLEGKAPETANPSLWRQAQILTQHGLFKVHERIYQVRGFDVSTVSFIDAGTGWIVVDPLTSVEVARAALELANEHVAAKPVLAVVYSHSHVDHYGGVGGVINAADAAAGKVKVIAPEGFLEHAVSENIIAGPAMLRRARFQFGLTLPRGAEGEMTSGLGPRPSLGSLSLIAPNELVTRTGQQITVGDVTMVFQLTPGTEAPAEMNFYLPQFRAIFMAENANLTMHNLLPARGALVRDAKAWADYLTESIRLFAGKSDVMFAAHGIPRFGQAEIAAFLNSHRDAYKFLHDQSVRLMNSGLTPTEIAEELALPEVLAMQWFNRGYYGTMSHNSKAIYQRYLGWYDANPVNLNPLPPEPAAKKYVEAMGGAANVMELAGQSERTGDLRWAATLLNHVVFADDKNQPARDQLAGVYAKLAFEAEAGSWRNIYLTGAQELRQGPVILRAGGFSPDVLSATTTSMLLDFAAVRVNPQKAATQFKINIELTDRKETHLITVGNGVLIHEEGVNDAKAGLTVRMKRPDLLMTLLAGLSYEARIESGDIVIEGDASLYGALVGLIEPIVPNFAIVTP